MKDQQRRSWLLGAFACGLLLSCMPAFGQVAPNSGIVSSRTPEQVIAAWPSASRLLARVLLVKYGTPQVISPDSLTWENNRPYLKTIVFKTAPWMKGDILQQTIRYRGASVGAVDRLVAFDKRIVVDQANGTMTMTSENESINRLVLNLADEIATGVKTAKQARVAYKKEQNLSKSGKSSPYLDSFKFPVLQ